MLLSLESEPGGEVATLSLSLEAQIGAVQVTHDDGATLVVVGIPCCPNPLHPSGRWFASTLSLEAFDRMVEDARIEAKLREVQRARLRSPGLGVPFVGA